MTVAETEKETVEAVQKVNQFWYETSQAVVQSTFDVQDRSMQYVQNAFVDGIETLKSHIEASQNLLQVEKKRQDLQGQQEHQGQTNQQEHKEQQGQQEHQYEQDQKEHQRRQEQQEQQRRQEQQEHQVRQEQQESVLSFVESGVEAYKRNATFLQRTVEQGFETFRSNAGVMRDLTQTLLTKAQEQRGLFW